MECLDLIHVQQLATVHPPQIFFKKLKAYYPDSPQDWKAEINVSDDVLIQVKHNNELRTYLATVERFHKNTVIFHNVIEYRMGQKLIGTVSFEWTQIEFIRLLSKHLQFLRITCPNLITQICSKNTEEIEPKTKFVMLEGFRFKQLQERKSQYIMVDNSEIMKDAREVLMEQSHIAIAGCGMKSIGSVMYLAVDTWAKTYVFYFQNPRVALGLVPVLQNPNVIKVGYDLADLSKCLFLKHDIMLYGWIDLSDNFDNMTLNEVLYRELHLPIDSVIPDQIEFKISEYPEYRMDSFFISIAELAVYLIPLQQFLNWKYKAITDALMEKPEKYDALFEEDSDIAQQQVALENLHL